MKTNRFLSTISILAISAVFLTSAAHSDQVFADPIATSSNSSVDHSAETTDADIDLETGAVKTSSGDAALTGEEYEFGKDVYTNSNYIIYHKRFLSDHQRYSIVGSTDGTVLLRFPEDCPFDCSDINMCPIGYWADTGKDIYLYDLDGHLVSHMATVQKEVLSYTALGYASGYYLIGIAKYDESLGVSQTYLRVLNPDGTQAYPDYPISHSNSNYSGQDVTDLGENIILISDYGFINLANGTTQQCYDGISRAAGSFYNGVAIVQLGDSHKSKLAKVYLDDLQKDNTYLSLTDIIPASSDPDHKLYVRRALYYNGFLLGDYSELFDLETNRLSWPDDYRVGPSSISIHYGGDGYWLIQSFGSSSSDFGDDYIMTDKYGNEVYRFSAYLQDDQYSAGCVYYNDSDYNMQLRLPDGTEYAMGEVPVEEIPDDAVIQDCTISDGFVFENGIVNLATGEMLTSVYETADTKTFELPGENDTVDESTMLIRGQDSEDTDSDSVTDPLNLFGTVTNPLLLDEDGMKVTLEAIGKPVDAVSTGARKYTFSFIAENNSPDNKKFEFSITNLCINDISITRSSGFETDILSGEYYYAPRPYDTGLYADSSIRYCCYVDYEMFRDATAMLGYDADSMPVETIGFLFQYRIGSEGEKKTEYIELTTTDYKEGDIGPVNGTEIFTGTHDGADFRVFSVELEHGACVGIYSEQTDINDSSTSYGAPFVGWSIQNNQMWQYYSNVIEDTPLYPGCTSYYFLTIDPDKVRKECELSNSTPITVDVEIMTDEGMEYVRVCDDYK